LVVDRETRQQGDPIEAGDAAVDVYQLRFGRLTLQLGLDFANTLNSRLTAHPQELLNGYADLVSWSQQAKILTAREAEHLGQQAARRTTEAMSAYEHAIVWREAIYRIFSAVAGRRSAPAADLETLNAILSDALGLLRIVATGDGFIWAWSGLDDALDRVLWPIALSAAALLTSSELRTVRECAAPNCSWLFLDTTRNRSRRWCDMRVCGNRAKAHRHYERKKRAGAHSSDRSNRR
jgi:predicted RNA-binding Zn ribbon-like protein